MSKSLCITIDVEPDCDTNWNRSSPLTFSNVEHGVGELLQGLFAKCSARPTYLISPEVLNHQPSVDVLASLRDCELGTHLHSEYIGTSIKYPDPAGTASNEFPSSLARHEQLDKLTAITKLFEQQFGYRPASYRAARFGANADTFEHLTSLGYLVDSSVTPRIDWRDKGGPDFSDCPDQPYWLEGKRLLEVPVTILGKRCLCLPYKWMAYRWLRPSVMTAGAMKRVIDAVADRSGESATLNMMFHSMEVVPRKSPYVRTRLGQKLYLSRLAKTIQYARQQGFQCCTLRELHDGWS
jgi:hypothetical protein